MLRCAAASSAGQGWEKAVCCDIGQIQTANMMTASLTTSTGIRLQPARRLSSPNRANRTIVRPLAALMPADYGWVHPSRRRVVCLILKEQLPRKPPPSTCLPCCRWVMASVAYTAAVSQ
jgi:hypothetical protein